MKKNSFRFIAGMTLIVAATTVKAQNIGINTTGTNPSINAILDLNTGNSNNLGLIIPNVSLTALATFNPPIANAATGGDVGMMVYNTNGAVGSGVGYYYWNGGTWVSVSGAAATVTAANDGTSLNGTTVIFGNAFGGTTGELTQNTEVPFNGKNLTFSNVGGSGNLGIDLAASTSAAQALEIGGVANTARIDGLGSAGTTYNQVTANKGDLVFANDANGDLWSLKAPSVASVLISSATGVLSWQNGTVPTGSGTLNYLARWTPSGTQLGIGITQDNGTEVGIQTAAYAFTAGNPLLQVTANATNVNAILGTTAQATGYGVEGTNTAGSGTTSGVYGSSTSATGFGVEGINNVANGIGVVGSNSATTGTSEGVEGYIGAVVAPTNPSGVYGSEAANTANLSGVRGVSTATTANAFGVYGSSTSSGGYGVYGSNSNLNGIGVYGINNAAHASGLPGFGIYGQTDQEGFIENSSIAGIQEGSSFYNNSIQGLADYPFYNTFNDGPAYGSGVSGVGLAQGVYGYAPNPFGFGGAGVTGIVNGGAISALVQNGQSYGVLGEMGTVGAGIAGYANGINTFPAAIGTAGSMGVANGTGSTIGAVGVNTNANGVGSAGLGNNMAAFVIPGTGAGAANTGNTIGDVGYAKSAGAGVGVVGVGNNIGVATVPAAGAGGAFIGVSEGSIGYANNGAGVGVIGVGNNLGASTIPAAGSGGAFDGTTIGDYGYASTVGTGTGMVGIGNGIGGITVLGTGSGGAFNGVTYGLYAKSTGAGNPSGAIECTNTATGNTVYVDYWNGTNYKILGTTPGTVSCSVLNSKGQSVVMHAPETPEAYYEDYGQGKLVSGRVHIDMDPDFAKNICVNEKHPLRVFIQLEGDCKGVFVTNKTATGFDVIELDGGTSNISFQYHIIGNQADAVMPSGVVSKFADLRFEPTPKADNTITIEAQKTIGTTVTSIEKTSDKPNLPAMETPKPGQAAKIPAEIIQKYQASLNSGGQK